VDWRYSRFDAEKAGERNYAMRNGLTPPPPPFPKLDHGVVHQSPGEDQAEVTGSLAPQGRLRRLGTEGRGDDVIGHGFQLVVRRRPDLDDAQSSALAAIGCALLVLEDASDPAYAEDLGMALQLTNILRDVGPDHARGRIYLPEAERIDFGYTEEALARRERNEAFLDLMRFQAERARAFFAAAERELSRLDRRPLFAAEIMARVYRRLLDRIEASGFDVFRGEIRVPQVERIWIAASTALAFRTAR